MSKSPAFVFNLLLVSGIFAAAQSDHAATANQAIARAKTQLQSVMGIADFQPDFDSAGDLAPSEHWFDPDKLRQAALAARPDYSGRA